MLHIGRVNKEDNHFPGHKLKKIGFLHVQNAKKSEQKKIKIIRIATLNV